MNTKISIFSFLVFLIGLFPFEINSCTTFCIKDKYGNIYFGRNYDFPTGLAHIQVNLRNIEKSSFISFPEKPFTWTSKYGSVSFNQFGREFPNGGINEAGLAIELMMLDESMYPMPDNRYGLEELQWIQYQLDVSATVEDVINSDKLIRISYTSIAPIHFSVTDANGNFAIIEYLNGKMVYHSGKSLKYCVLANETYKTALDYKKKYDIDKKAYADQRFVKAAAKIDSLDKNMKVTVDIAFDILNYVSQGDWTRWSIVYDVKRKCIYYKTGNNITIRKIELNLFDFSNTATRLYIDIDDHFNSISDFKEYNFEANYKLVDTVWTMIDMLLKDLPFKKEWAQYPDDVNNITVRKFKFSAAKSICDILRNSNYESVKSKIQKIITSKDKYYFAESEFYYQISIKLGNKNKLNEALEVHKIVVSIYPQSSVAYCELAKTYTQIGNKNLAIENLKKALELNPENEEAQEQLVKINRK